MSKPPHPIVKAADIEKALSDRTHWLNDKAVRKTACISDMAGMGNSLGVHKVTVGPGSETTEMHHHLNEAEWMYILRGSLVVHLTPVAYEEGGQTSGMVPIIPHPLPVEEHPVSAGDFIGFPGGLGVHYAHTMVAGSDGAEFLVGGTRNAMDVCSYPLKEKTLIIAGAYGPRGAIESKNIKDPATVKWS